MPRKKTAASSLTEPTGRRRSSRHVASEGGIPEIYRDMLVEAAESAPLMANNEGRAAKRRRVEEPQISSMEEPEDAIKPETGSVPPITAKRTIYDDFTGSDESDVDFEDVVLTQDPKCSDGGVENERPLQLDLSRPLGRQDAPLVQRRKPATTAEKRLRLDVHKWHVLCLLLHGYHRNRWCDNEEVQEILKPLIPRKLINRLHLDESQPQYARNHSFNKAMEEISDIWRREWTITTRGIRRAFWAEDVDVLREVSPKLPSLWPSTYYGADR
jgi:xeroderma pigmentosum group C-complementing protein